MNVSLDCWPLLPPECRSNLVSDATDLVKEAAALVQAATDLVQGKSEKDKPSTRSGPLQVAGRLYLSLTALLAVFATGAAYFDDGKISSTTTHLRYAVLVAVFLGITGVALLVWHLARKSPSWLSNPAEFSPGAQLGMLGISVKESGKEISISDTDAKQ